MLLTRTLRRHRRTAAFLAGAALLAAFLAAASPRGNTRNAETLDAFARCLARSGVMMYGTDSCPHCQNEKKAFGESFRFIRSIECTRDPRACLSQNISRYPTWILGDGRRLIGEQGLARLAEASGCALQAVERGVK